MKIIILTFFCFFVSTYSQECNDNQHDTSVGRATFNVFYKLINQTSGNTVFSPASITMLMGMLSLGAAGQTELQIDEFFQFKKHCLKEELSQFISGMSSINDVDIGNYVFIQKDFRIKMTYLKLIRESLQSTCRKFDFLNKPYFVREKINKIVENDTYGLLKEFLKNNLPANTKLFMLNTINFFGEWIKSFTYIGNRKFNNLNNGVENVPTIELENSEVFYYNDNETEIFSIKYDGDFVFTIFLPTRGKNLDDIDIKPKFRRFREYGIFRDLKKLQMPKFKSDHETDVKKVLRNLGLNLSQGDYSKINKALDVSEILHRAVIDVDENGTKAAGAAGGLVVFLSQNDPPPPVEIIIVDRPFLYTITDKKYSSILFAGKLTSLN